MNNNFASENDRNLYQRGINHNLVGMNTNFRNMNIVNSPMNTADLYDKGTLDKYNVIKKNELKSEFINKQHKVIATFKNVGNATSFNIDFDQQIKDIVSIKLLNGYWTQVVGATPNTPEFIAIKIDEISKNKGYAKTITDVFDNSFGTLDYDGTSQYITSVTHNMYRNSFATNNDIEYFDPPLHSLSRLTITLTGADGTVQNGVGKLEFLIETKEKMRIY